MAESKKYSTSNWEDEDDLTPDMSAPYWVERLETATLTRGCPKLEKPKVSMTIRFDADVLARFRVGGACWQSRINAALRQWLAETVRRPE